MSSCRQRLAPLLQILLPVQICVTLFLGQSVSDIECVLCWTCVQEMGHHHSTAPLCAYVSPTSELFDHEY